MERCSSWGCDGRSEARTQGASIAVGYWRDCGRRPRIIFVDDLASRCHDVIGAPSVGGSQILPQQSGRATRPEQQSHTETDREADRDVLDPDHPDSPAGGLDDVEEHEKNDCETG